MALTLTIGGSNFLPQYKTNSARVVDTLQHRANTLTLEITKKAAQSAPDEGKEIVFKDGSRFLFAGFITRVSPIEIGKGDLFTYRVEATDYTYILINKNAQKTYENQTLKQIVEDLLSTYVAAGYGFTSTNVATGPTIEKITFNHIPLRKCFENLAKVSGYEWYVDYEKDVYFKAKEVSSAQESLTEEADPADNNHIGVSIETDVTQVRNSIVVRGGKEETTSNFQQVFVADGEAREWLLREKPTTMVDIEVDTGGGYSSQNFGEDPNDEETGNAYMWNGTEKYIRVVTAGGTPSSGDLIRVTYKYEVPVIVKLKSALSIAAMAALEGGDGLHERTITNSSIKSKDLARQVALKELVEYANPLVNGQFITRTGLLNSGTFFKPGQELTVNLPAWGVSTDTKYLIQEVITTLVEDGSTIEYNYSVRFGGRLLNAKSFLEQLAGKEEVVLATEEIDRIEAIQEDVTIAETITQNDNEQNVSESVSIAEVITDTNYTPPFEYGPSGSPQGVWNSSEWG